VADKQNLKPNNTKNNLSKMTGSPKIPEFQQNKNAPKGALLSQDKEPALYPSI
jgi:hypothetical protein